MKTYREVGISPPFLTSTLMNGKLHGPDIFIPSSHCIEAEWARELVWTLPLLGINPGLLNCPAHSLVTVSNQLSRILLRLSNGINCQVPRLNKFQQTDTSRKQNNTLSRSFILFILSAIRKKCQAVD
jgi:hypothetical protein